MSASYFERFPPHRLWPQEYRQLEISGHDLIDFDTRIMCLGSCFATNVIKCLDLVDLNLDDPFWGLKYSTHSIYRELDVARSGKLTGPQYVYPGELGYTDLNHHRIYSDSVDGLLKIVNTIERSAQDMLPGTEVFVIVISQNEVWKNRRNNKFILHPYPGVLYVETDLEVHHLTMKDNLEYLQKSYRILKSFNPDMHIVMMVCPISLRATCRDSDAVFANNISKFTLYTAVHEFCQMHGDVHYFPGYDIIEYKARHESIYESDARHLVPEMTNGMLSAFARSFFRADLRHSLESLAKVHAGVEVYQSLDELVERGYPMNLLKLRKGLQRLAGGEWKQAFREFGAIPDFENMPFVLYLMALAMDGAGYASKARVFFKTLQTYLKNIKSLALEWIRRDIKVRFGYNHIGDGIGLNMNYHELRGERLRELKTVANLQSGSNRLSAEQSGALAGKLAMGLYPSCGISIRSSLDC